ncbi:MAG: septum site-determining protein MinD [Proteocatella sp.]|jgi:septum site-determining protein MinD|nr:septum site-determining protein MinD [Proteocatella sp.]MBP7913122.1 septum site-determining protein MinD [Proteocatella sp.]MBP8654009.1 septum site-determining protein MinD [Proteocatella sp.]MBP9658512.1 septum site-determining protein MinD [Proteocatella sp.]MBP9966504.1 septum site-determining protein MinD [Proteocatella sp.]
MGKVIVVTSGKGGVGKTTSTANIGAALTKLGNKVIVIDGDIGLRNLDVVMGLENRIVFDLVDLIEKKCKPRQAMIKDKRFDGLYLIPAAQTRDKDAINPEQMKELCDELKEEFDYVIVDCPAGIENGFKNAIAGADSAIVVTTPEVSAVRDADRIIGLLEAHSVDDINLVVNRIKMNMVRNGDMLDINDILDILGIKLIGVVPDDENVVISTNKGEPVVEYNNSLAGTAYSNIARRVMGEEVKFLELDVQESFFRRFQKLFLNR